MPIPLLAKQVYLIWVGIIVAYIFTFIPEWTAWVILVLMALYDIAAVLIPGGPLKVGRALPPGGGQAVARRGLESRPCKYLQGPATACCRRNAPSLLIDDKYRFSCRARSVSRLPGMLLPSACLPACSGARTSHPPPCLPA